MINWLFSWGEKVSWVLYIKSNISFIASRFFSPLKLGGCMGSCFPSLLGAVCYSAFVCHGQNKPGYKYGNRLRYSAAPFRSGGGYWR